MAMTVMAQGTHRFTALRRRIDGVSERMLARTLKSLEADALVTWVVLATVPPHVEYSLASLDEEAVRPVGQLTDWLEISMPTIMRQKTASGPASRVALD